MASASYGMVAAGYGMASLDSAMTYMYILVVRLCDEAISVDWHCIIWVWYVKQWLTSDH